MKRLALILVAAPLVLAACGSKKDAQAPSPETRTNGEIVYSVSQSDDQPEFEECPGLWAVRPEGTDLHVIAPDDSTAPALSPDGKRLALFGEGVGEGPDVWMMDLTSGMTRRLAKAIQSNPYIYPWFAWSPTGDALLLVRTVRGRDEIDRLDVEDGKTTTLVQAGKDELAFPAWAPDGSLIAYSHLSDKGAEIWLMTPDGSQRHKLVENGMAPVWFPDSARIAFFQGNRFAERAPLRSIDVGGGKETELTDAFNGGPASVRWSPDGKSLLFVRPAMKPNEWNESDLFRFDLDTGHDELVAANADPAGWSPAGDRILFMRAFEPQQTTVVGIYTSKPDGDDEQLLGVADENDLASPPVWRAGTRDIVAPPAFARFNASSSCPARLERLRAKIGKQGNS